MVKVRLFFILVSGFVFLVSEGCWATRVEPLPIGFVDSWIAGKPVKYSEGFAYPEISDQAKREAAEHAKRKRNAAKRKMVLFAAHNRERVDQQLPSEIVNYLGTFVVSQPEVEGGLKKLQEPPKKE